VLSYLANLTSENKDKCNLTENRAKTNKYSLNISASSGAKIIKIRLELTSLVFKSP
jgi:hypothetical protein